MDKKDLKNRNEIILLIDIYGELLTEKQRKILELYFFDDFALVEIASINKSSRQSILYSINKSIEQLYSFEEKLKVLERDRELDNKKDQLIEKLEEFLDFSLNQEGMAFDGLASKLQGVFKKLRGKGKLSEQDIKLAMREVKLALLESDVNYRVVKTFISSVSEKSLGKEVLESLTPAQQVIKIVNDELKAIM